LNIRKIGVEEPRAAPGSAAFWDALARLDAPALKRYRDAAKTFADACLDMRLETLTAAQREALGQVLGLLLIDGVHACMGLRVRADLVLTARHCLYAFDEVLGWQPRGARSIELVLPGAPAAKVALRELDCRNAAGDPACAEPAADPVAADHLLLKVAPRKASAKASAAAGTAAMPNPPLPPMPELVFELPTAREFLVVPGHSSWYTGRSWAAGDRPFATAAGLSGCLVESLDNACLINACQSNDGFSGTPILARRNTDKLVVVGIFLGAAAAYPACQRTEHNFGAVLPGYVRRERLTEIARGRS
jgi:hypothetical protein